MPAEVNSKAVGLVNSIKQFALPIVVGHNQSVEDMDTGERENGSWLC